MKANSWSEIPNILPYGGFIGNGQSVYLNDNFYWAPTWATGNSNGWGSHNKILKYNYSSNSASEIIALRSSPIWGVGVEIYNNDVYFFGGHDGSDQSDIWKFSPTQNKVEQIGNMSVKRNGSFCYRV